MGLICSPLRISDCSGISDGSYGWTAVIDFVEVDGCMRIRIIAERKVGAKIIG